MDFSSISNINSYVKTANMNHIWKQKADNPFNSIIPGSTAKSSNEAKTATASPIDDRYMSIISKIKSGQKVSSEDMDYLRENYPADYDEVRKLEKEKEQFSEDLGRCKTKSDARMLHQGKITEAFAALKGSAVSSELILAKLAKMTEVYGRFTESKHYSELAENYMELEEAIEAEKEAVSGKIEDVETELENGENNIQIEDNTAEPQDQSIQTGQSVPADIEAPPPHVAVGDSPKPADTGNPAPAPKVKVDVKSIDVKPSYFPNRAAAKAISGTYTAKAVQNNPVSTEVTGDSFEIFA